MPGKGGRTRETQKIACIRYRHGNVQLSSGPPLNGTKAEEHGTRIPIVTLLTAADLAAERNLDCIDDCTSVIQKHSCFSSYAIRFSVALFSILTKIKVYTISCFSGSGYKMFKGVRFITSSITSCLYYYLRNHRNYIKLLEIRVTETNLYFGN